MGTQMGFASDHMATEVNYRFSLCSEKGTSLRMSDGVENAASAAAPKSGADAPDVPLEKVKKPNRPDDETQKQKVDELQEISKFSPHHNDEDCI